jgi:hypothetical protein
MKAMMSIIVLLFCDCGRLGSVPVDARPIEQIMTAIEERVKGKRTAGGEFQISGLEKGNKTLY